MLRQYVDLSCQDDEPDAGARELLGGRPGPKLPKSRVGGGTSPLHLASCRGHVGVVHELLLAGADASRGDQFGFSSLHLAARHGFPDVLTELLTFSTVSVDLVDESGETALHTAARYSKTLCVSRLLEFGGDLTIVSTSGRRPVDVIGQGQDKHNRLSLPHSATQLAVGRRSVKHNTNMPPAQLRRDKSAEERVRRLLAVAASGRSDAWMWPTHSHGASTAAVGPRTKWNEHDNGTNCSCTALSVKAVVTADDKIEKAVENTTLEGAINVGGGARLENGEDVVDGDGVRREEKGGAGRGEEATISKSPLARLHVRDLVKGRRGNTRVFEAIDR